MTDLISQLQSQTGLDGDIAKKGFGALLNFLKEQLPADLFAKVESAVPQAGDSISAFLSGQEAPGLLDKVGGIVGGLLGGKAGDLSKLFEMLARSGMTLDQAKSFLPKAIELLKRILPAEVLEQITARLPGVGEALQQAEAS